MKKLIIGIAVVIVVSFGCYFGFKSIENYNLNQGDVIVVDQLGREVAIDSEPEKVVTSYYATTALMIALDAQDKLVGIEMKANTRELYKTVAPELLDLPAVGNSKTINVEMVASLEPDLVILPMSLKEYVDDFENLNIPVIVVNVETMDAFLESIDIIGQAVNREKEAEQLISYYNEQIDFAANISSSSTISPSVYISGPDSPLMTATGAMYQTYFLEAAGATNVAQDVQGNGWMQISKEQLLSWNPDYIFIVGYANYDKSVYLEDPALANLDAVKNDQIYVIPSSIEDWDYPTPSSILGILWELTIFYPEEYSVSELEKEAQYFFETFYKIDLNELGITLW